MSSRSGLLPISCWRLSPRAPSSLDCLKMPSTSNESDAASGERPHLILTVCGGTNVGSQREQNQDTFVIADLKSGRLSRPCIRTDLRVSRPGVLMLVCDGMGGRAAGDVAADLAATFIRHELLARGD